jgi:hypothetical protein
MVSVSNFQRGLEPSARRGPVHTSRTCARIVPTSCRELVDPAIRRARLFMRLRNQPYESADEGTYQIPRQSLNGDVSDGGSDFEGGSAETWMAFL